MTEITTRPRHTAEGQVPGVDWDYFFFLNKDRLLQPKLTSNYAVVSALNYSLITCLHVLSTGIMGI